MYSEQDRIEIRQRIRKYLWITIPVTAALLFGYVEGMANRWEIWVMIDSVLIFAFICFMILMFVYPCVRYNRFLKDMAEGLHRELEGSVVEISEAEEVQDGVRVLPVRILLKEEQDERIVYLNVSKRALFPKEGADVRLNCFGRHIREVAVL